MAYVYYLPFSMVVHLRRSTSCAKRFPLFLREDQSYLPVSELKPALQELDSHFDKLPDEVKRIGGNAVRWLSAAPDQQRGSQGCGTRPCAPDWRKISEEQEAALVSREIKPTTRTFVDHLNENSTECPCARRKAQHRKT